MRIPSLIALTLAAGSLVGCASGGGIPEPFPTPKEGPTRPANIPVATSGRVTTADRYGIAGTALTLRGRPYRDGGADPRGFDCSGLISYVFAQHGITVPRTVQALFDAGTDVSTSDIEAGDLVFFSTTGPGPTHVGLAIGGDEFVHAPSGAGIVRVERWSGAYWGQRFIGARRVL
jgi:cell wall-associated NlpC family hydrolase